MIGFFIRFATPFSAWLNEGVCPMGTGIISTSSSLPTFWGTKSLKLLRETTTRNDCENVHEFTRRPCHD